MSTPMLKEPRASQPIARSRKCRKRITLIAGAECNKKQKFREIVYDRALIMNRCGIPIAYAKNCINWHKRYSQDTPAYPGVSLDVRL